jgi:drug/metabolite transporter superfamily protein YnfA
MLCRVLKGLVVVLAVLYVVALLLFLVGNFGLFGSDSGPLAGVFLVPLGLPWNHMIDVFPEPFWPWLGAAAPLVNIAIAYGAWRLSRRA